LGVILNPKLTINLPTIRPEGAVKVIESLNAYNCPFPYEIGVCCPTKIEGKNVVWIKDPNPTLGPVPASDLIYKKSKAEYHMLTTDCQTFQDGWWLPVLELMAMGDLKYKLLAFSQVFPLSVLNIQTAGWWVVAKTTIDNQFNGQWLPEGYGLCYANVEMCLKMFFDGHPVKFTSSSMPGVHLRIDGKKFGRAALQAIYDDKDWRLLTIRVYPLLKKYFFENFETWQQAEIQFTDDWTVGKVWQTWLKEEYSNRKHINEV